MAAFTLVHSPLVGPLTWSFVRDELVRRGHDARVPSLVRAAESGDVHACIDAARAGVCPTSPGDVHVIAGHSGAGALLPSIATGLDPEPRLVFVDAGLPPVGTEMALLPADLLEHLRTLAVDGRLPPWSEWFGPAVMEQLVPDEALRAALTAELPRLPLHYFESTVRMPSDWGQRTGAYVLLSEAYRADATSARARGWPVFELLGTHLDLVTHPIEIAGALVAAAGL